jgi:hypothetical protein
MKSPERSRAVGFASKSPNPVLSANFTPETKLDFIRKGKKKKTITGFKENKNVTFENKGGKFIVVEKEKKFEESAVTQRKNNFVKFESKLGTEKETDLTKIAGIKKTREIQPRTEEKIIQKKKKKEYLDNYQYHETVDIKHPKPNRISIVAHKRLGEIIGGTEEITTYERTVKTTMGDGKPAQITRQKATSVKKTQNDPNKPGTSTITKTTKRELKPNNSQTNLRNNQKIMQASASTRRLNRGGAKDDKDDTENTKEETKLVTQEGETTKTTRKTRGRRSILKK